MTLHNDLESYESNAKNTRAQDRLIMIRLHIAEVEFVLSTEGQLSTPNRSVCQSFELPALALRKRAF